MFQSVFRRIVLISAGLLSFAARSSAEEAYPMYKPFFPAREDGKYEFINPSDPKVIEAMTKRFPEWKKRYAVRSLEERCDTKRRPAQARNRN